MNATPNNTNSAQVYELAARLVKAGLSVIPIQPDGSKSPAVPSWKEYQTRLPSVQELAGWFKGRVRGIAAIGGSVSGGLECIDFDEPGLFEDWAAELDKLAPDLLDRCVIVKTPSVGAHVWYRCATVQGNKVLAKRPPTPQEAEEFPEMKSYKRIETRGSGGYAIIPGSPPQCHPFGVPYTYHERGLQSIEKVQEITTQEREILFALAMSYTTFAEAPKSQTPPPRGKQGEGLKPGDDFEVRGSWQDILEPKGWHVDSGTWEQGRLTRPQKDHGHSATVGFCRGKQNEPLFFVFSSSAGIDVGCYGKFRAFAHLYHGGDYKKAAAELREKGYGEPLSRPTNGKTPTSTQPQTQESTQGASNEYAELVVKSLAGRKVKPVRYLVEGKIPVGKVTMIAGVGGMGKSTLTRHLIACLTTGRPAFGMEYSAPPPCDVLLASVEDSPEDTIVPHLIAENADLDRVQLIEGIRLKQTDEKPNTQLALFDLRNMELVVTHVKANPSAKLLIIDPIMSFIGRAGVNENRSGEVRALLDPLIALCEGTGIAVLLIAHLNKATNSAAVNRIVGSTAFRDSCRVVYAVGCDPEDNTRRIMALVKENVPGIDRSSVVFTRELLSKERLEEVLAYPEFSDLEQEDRDRISAQLACVRPAGTSQFDADSVLNSTKSTDAPTVGASLKCAAWIRQRLGTEFCWPDHEIEEEAIAAGYSIDQYRRAKKQLKPALQSVPPAYGKPWLIGFGNVRQMPIANNSQSQDPETQTEIPQ